MSNNFTHVKTVTTHLSFRLQNSIVIEQRFLISSNNLFLFFLNYLKHYRVDKQSLIPPITYIDVFFVDVYDSFNNANWYVSSISSNTIYLRGCELKPPTNQRYESFARIYKIESDEFDPFFFVCLQNSNN